MKLLFDTHTFLWAIAGSSRLSPRAAAVFLAPENEIYLSYASLWEIVIKAGLGKLRLPLPAVEFVRATARENRVTLLPLALAHLQHLERLPLHHRDPFGRMLVAQAQAEQMPLVSCDGNLGHYAVATLW